ncbi:MAG: nucleoside phosphorylase [Planctomycetes bacterium]|nr:nucleoside phosphorylase [Planctomycetota bacterium]
MAKGKRGRQYHVGVGPGQVAPYILLCGDPARAEKIARRFDSSRGPWCNREYVTYTGTRGGIDITVTGTGIGPDNMEIALIELAQCVRNPTFIRIGSCGALQRQIGLGDLVVSTGSVRLENTSTYFVPEGYPAVANYEIVVALATACARLGYPHHVGLTATAPGFYGAQSRIVAGFPPRWKDIPADLARVGVLNLEMEISALLTLASVGGYRAGAVCAVYAQRPRSLFIESPAKEHAEARAIDAALAALEVLKTMDDWRRRTGAKHWRVQ